MNEAVRIALLGAVAAFSLSEPLLAQVLDKRFSERAFTAADQNKDGVVDQAEFDKDVLAAFMQLDADRDQTLGKNELATLDAAVVSVLDSDHNGQLSLTEVKQSKTKDFKAADDNHDGKLSLDEVVTFDSVASDKE